jgi:hypothetical protein
MGMELRCSVSVNRAGGVMLEGSGYKLPGSFGRMIASNAGLCVVLQLILRKRDSFPVGLAHLFIATYKGC